MGHLKKSSTTGHLLKSTAGHLVDSCEPCLIWQDTFNRADSTTLGGQWIEQAGDSAIVSNALRFTTANALATSDEQADNNSGFQFYIKATVRASASGDVARVYFWLNSTNWTCLELTFGAGGGLKIITNESGSQSTLRECSDSESLLLSTATWYEVVFGYQQFCHTNGALCQSHQGTWSALIDNVPYITSPEDRHLPSDLHSVGLGTGATVTGNVEFDSVRVEYIHDDSLTVGCRELVMCQWPLVEGDVDEIGVEIQDSTGCNETVTLNRVFAGTVGNECAQYTATISSVSWSLKVWSGASASSYAFSLFKIPPFTEFSSWSMISNDYKAECPASEVVLDSEDGPCGGTARLFVPP
jgi:hypothetical protein